MFEIKVASDDVTGGSIPITWCVDMETIKNLNDRIVKDPMVVIVVAPGDSSYSVSKEVRTVVPLKDMMAWVSFRYPGPNRVWAFISKRGKDDAKETYLTKKGRTYSYDILTFYGMGYSVSSSSYEKELQSTFQWDESPPIELDVPTECFAREPSNFEKLWVNWLIDDKAEDQCSFRRRRMFAYTLQIPIFIGSYILRILFTLISALILAKDFSLKHLIHPLENNSYALLDMVDNGSILTNNNEKGWKRVKYWPFMPIFILPLLTLIALSFKHHSPGLKILCGILLGILLLVGIVFSCFGYFEWKLKKEVEAPAWYMDKEEMDIVVCNEGKPLTFKTLPAKKKTLKLRYLDLKSKVCKPFAG